VATRKKQKRIRMAWAAEFSGPSQYKVAVQPVGQWCVLIDPASGRYKVTHLPTGLAGFATSDIEEARAVLKAWSRLPGFTFITWTKTLSKRFQRARDKALQP
jgi:hypothetical protein